MYLKPPLSPLFNAFPFEGWTKHTIVSPLYLFVCIDFHFINSIRRGFMTVLASFNFGSALSSKTYHMMTFNIYHFFFSSFLSSIFLIKIQTLVVGVHSATGVHVPQIAVKVFVIVTAFVIHHHRDMVPNFVR